MSGSFWLAIAGEDTLLISKDSEDAWLRLEICEVPDLFSNNSRELVEDAMIHIEILGLILLRPWQAVDRVATSQGICAVFSDDDWDAVLRGPAGEIFDEVLLG